MNKKPKIAIIAPSSTISEELFHKGVNILKNNRLDVFIHPQCQLKNHASAGTSGQKSTAFQEVITDPSIDIVMAGRGGNRAAHILDELDYNIILQNKKLYIGFSDSTAISCALYKKAGLPSLWGPVVQSLPLLNQDSLDFFFSLIHGKKRPYPTGQSEIFYKGKGSGPLLGGSLSIICAQIGTDYMPNFNGAILFLEDVGEELSRIDRMLLQLKRALPFEKLSGILFGQFTKNKDTGTPFGFTLKEIIKEHTDGLNIPIITNAPFGHTETFYALPFGQKATLDTLSESPSLTFNHFNF